MWFDESVIYQIYPLGYVGAPKQNDGVCVHRINNIIEHISHYKKLNVNAIYFCPIFESSNHGYDTKDYSKIDCRLGDNEDFKNLCQKLHENDIKVIIDGVFNHVGRDFFAFQDVKQNKWNSPYKDWFYINFDGNSCYDDGFYYEGWEGHYELVKLNLDNENLKKHLLDCVRMWIEYFDIDGIRLDVAYMLNKNFMRDLRHFCDGVKPDFVLIGEMIHGDYNTIVNSEMLHSATNYECFKGVFSSFNDLNMFEISYSLNRQFGSENWCLYTGKNLVSFVDNHDVERIATSLKNKNHLKLAFGLMFTMPGIPCIYYGSEWGIEGAKTAGSDDSLRPEIKKPIFNELSEFIAALAKIKRESKALCYGDFKNVHINNQQYVFERRFENERIVVLLNIAQDDVDVYLNLDAGVGVDVLSNNQISLNGNVKLPACSIQIVKV